MLEKRKMDATILRRLKTAIKLLQKEHVFIPTNFNFKGRCLLQDINKELRQLGEDISDEDVPIKSHPLGETGKDLSPGRIDSVMELL
jgi:hypothetical protein